MQRSWFISLSLSTNLFIRLRAGHRFLNRDLGLSRWSNENRGLNTFLKGYEPHSACRFHYIFTFTTGERLSLSTDSMDRYFPERLQVTRQNEDTADYHVKLSASDIPSRASLVHPDRTEIDSLWFIYSFIEIYINVMFRYSE